MATVNSSKNNLFLRNLPFILLYTHTNQGQKNLHNVQNCFQKLVINHIYHK